MALEKTLKRPLDCKETKPVHPKGNQSWIFIGRTDAEAETPILWPPDAKSWLIWKDPDAGKDWGQEEKGMTEDEMVGWHHRLDGHEFEETPGVSDGQGSLACYSPWGRKESHTTEWLNWTELLRECCMYQWTAWLLICLRNLSQEFIISCALIGTNYLFVCSPQMFPATCLSLCSLRGGVLLTLRRPLPSPGRSLISFGGGLPFIIYG